jgi:hypothetical protein
MTDEEIALRVAEISTVSDPTDRALQTALLVGRAFKDEGYDLVLVGGSAVEFYTDGLYVSGDIDLCFRSRSSQDLAASLMPRIGRKTTGRHYEVANCYVEILGTIETNARTDYKLIADQDGRQVLYVDAIEEVVAERVYRAEEEKRTKDIDCALKLLGTCVSGRVKVDWEEVRRLLRSSLYRSEPALDELLGIVKSQLGL